MIFSENNLYGWGATNIAMPRVAFELHPDSVRRTGEIAYHSRRGGATCRWRSSSIPRIFLDDYPWSQVLLLSILSSLILVCFYLLNSTLPRDQNKPLIRPVEIVVALHKDEPQKAAISVEQKPFVSLEPEVVEQDVIIESVTEEPEKEVIDRPKEVKQDVSNKMQKIVPEPRSPHIGIKQRVVSKKTQRPQSTASVKPLIERQTKTEQITISPPTVRKRNYMEKGTDKISQPGQASKVANFTSTKNRKPTEDVVDTGPLQRRKTYSKQTSERLNDPQLKTSANLFALNQSDKPAEPTSLKTKLAGPRYASKTNTLFPAAQTAPPSTNQQVLFQSKKRKEIPDLEPKKLDDQFTKPSPSSPSASKEAGQAISFTSSRQQIEFTGTKLSQSPQSDKRHVFQKRNQHQLDAPQSMKKEFSFQSEKLKQEPKLAPPVSDKLLAKANRSTRKGSSSLAKAHNFSGTVGSDEIDPSELISLQAFNVCIDPEMEFRQKTDLAAYLLGASRIEAEGVVFFIRYTESAHTIEIHIYNPHGRPFKDRCEVLELAIRSIVNRVN